MIDLFQLSKKETTVKRIVEYIECNNVSSIPLDVLVKYKLAHTTKK